MSTYFAIFGWAFVVGAGVLLVQRVDEHSAWFALVLANIFFTRSEIASLKRQLTP